MVAADASALYSRNLLDFMKLIMRSPDVGDGWRTITKNLWACIELHSRPELVESVQDETGGGRLRLTERGRIVFEYLT